MEPNCSPVVYFMEPNCSPVVYEGQSGIRHWNCPCFDNGVITLTVYRPARKDRD